MSRLPHSAPTILVISIVFMRAPTCPIDVATAPARTF
jgi:hypothetical protein